MAAGESVVVLASGAAVVLVGVLASLAFERWRVPEVLPLLLVGILLGPVLGVVDPGIFGGVAQVFATLALVVILFEGGLDLKLGTLWSRLGLTSALLVTTYFLTAVAIAIVGVTLAGLDGPLALLFGLVMAPLSSSILIPLVGRLKILPETRALLTVESALGDVLAVVAVVAWVEVLQGRALDVENVFLSLGKSFVLGGVLAAVAGALWLLLLRWLKGRPFTYLVTFAAAILLHGAVEILGGNGVVAVLVFALVLGNADLLARRLPGAVRWEIDTRIRWFHAEMSFFVRTFFFIYLGLLFTIQDAGLGLVLATGGVLAAILLVRWALVTLLVRRRPAERRDASYLTFLIPRGLASAALATLPAVVAVSEGTVFADLSFGTILLTNAVMTGFVLFAEKGPGAGAEPEATLVEFEDFPFEALDRPLEGEG